jgi:PhoPQ-activated pathogenicity-related protein
MEEVITLISINPPMVEQVNEYGSFKIELSPIFDRDIVEAIENDELKIGDRIMI